MEKERKPIVNLAKIKGLMAENGDTQESVAKDLNLSTTSYRKKINGNVEFKVSELVVLAERYNVDINIFLI